MAVRKEHYDEDQIDNAKKRSRITFDVSPELRRRIKIAALQNDLSIGEYLGGILDKAVPDEVSTPLRQYRPVTRKTLEMLDEVREQIMQRRNGKPFEDSTEMIRQMREERTRYLMGEEGGE